MYLTPICGECFFILFFWPVGTTGIADSDDNSGNCDGVDNCDGDDACRDSLLKGPLGVTFGETSLKGDAARPICMYYICVIYKLFMGWHVNVYICISSKFVYATYESYYICMYVFKWEAFKQKQTL